MKHILAIVQPALRIRGRKTHAAEFEYLRLVYAVTKIRQEGEDAKGYCIVISEIIPDYLRRWEHDYCARQSVKLICALPNHVSSPKRETRTDLSGVVAAALLDKTSRHKSVIWHDIQDSIVSNAMLSLEPHTQQINDKSRFPLGIRWDYYGIAIEESNVARPDLVSKFD